MHFCAKMFKYLLNLDIFAVAWPQIIDKYLQTPEWLSHFITKFWSMTRFYICIYSSMLKQGIAKKGLT